MKSWKIFVRGDGKAKLTISERNDGLYSFGVEEKYIRPDDDSNPIPRTGGIIHRASMVELIYISTMREPCS